MDSEDTASNSGDNTSLAGRLVILDLGKKSKRSIRKLKEGTGKTMLEVEDAIHQARLRLPEADRSKPFVPMVLIYELKDKDKDLPFLPFSPFNLLR